MKAASYDASPYRADCRPAGRVKKTAPDRRSSPSGITAASPLAGTTGRESRTAGEAPKAQPCSASGRFSFPAATLLLADPDRHHRSARRGKCAIRHSEDSGVLFVLDHCAPGFGMAPGYREPSARRRYPAHSRPLGCRGECDVNHILRSAAIPPSGQLSVHPIMITFCGLTSY